jgi:hypothetical protein
MMRVVAFRAVEKNSVALASQLEVDHLVIRFGIVAGASTRAVAKLFGCSAAHVDKAVDERLPTIDAKYRLRSMGLDLAQLEMLQGKFFAQASKGDVAAGQLVRHLMERRAAVLGYDSPIRVGPIELNILAAPQETSTGYYKRMLDVLDGTEAEKCGTESGTEIELGKQLQ